jgi:histidinol-phosphate aminotransferase
MNNLHKTIIILGIILIYIMVLSSKYLEDLDNVSTSNNQVVVITDLNFTNLGKYFDPTNYSVISLTEWKKSKIPLDIFINFPNGSISNIVQEIMLLENITQYVKPTGKIINFINRKSNKLGDYTLEKYFEQIAEKYYSDAIGFCTIDLDADSLESINVSPINSQTINFILNNNWNILTSRVFTNKKINEKSTGYLLSLTQDYKSSDTLAEKIIANKFNGETIIKPDINETELTVYSNTSGLLANKLAEIHNVQSNQIQFHNGIIGFLETMVNVFVPESYEIICWQMSYFKFIAKARKTIHINSVVSEQITKPNYSQLLDKITSKTRMIYLVGPLEKTQFDNFIKEVPINIPVIIDFCYDSFIPNPKNLKMEDCIKYKNYILAINTFSKFNGLPGIHLSYSIGHDEIQTIISNHFHYPVNLFYEKLALKSLDITYVNKVRQYYDDQRNKFSKLLTENKIPYWIEQVNTILIDISGLNKDKIEKNLSKTGLASYYKIVDNNIKIFISTDEINTKLINQIISL